MASRESDLLNEIEALRARNAHLERELAQYKELHPEKVETPCEGCGAALSVAFLDFNEDFGHLCDNCWGEWVRDIRDTCLRSQTPFFFKQWGGPVKKRSGRVLDGRTWDEIPKPVPA